MIKKHLALSIFLASTSFVVNATETVPPAQSLTENHLSLGATGFSADKHKASGYRFQLGQQWSNNWSISLDHRDGKGEFLETKNDLERQNSSLLIGKHYAMGTQASLYVKAGYSIERISYDAVEDKQSSAMIATGIKHRINDDFSYKFGVSYTEHTHVEAALRYQLSPRVAVDFATQYGNGETVYGLNLIWYTNTPYEKN